MSNRYTDTKKWEKAWYTGLSPQYKLFWNFLCDHCNIGGIWNVNWPLVKFHTWLEGPIDPADFGIREENKLPRVIPMGADKWRINGFVEYQQKIKSLEDLNPKNNAHLGIIKILDHEGLGRGYPAPAMPLRRGYGNGKGKLYNNKSIVNVIEREPKRVDIVKETEAQKFVREFGQVYQKCTGQEYKTDAKHFVIANRLIKTHGTSALRSKALMLAVYCAKAEVWFCKEGYANFTIETLSARWNNILPQERLTPEELKRQEYDKEYKKQQEDNARANEIIHAGRKTPNRDPAGPTVSAAGQTAAGAKKGGADAGTGK